jgi:nicotinamide-nucleotide amidase
MRLGVAESCTGGWIAKVLTDIPGSSNWFDRGFVTYSNVAKVEMLGVDAAVLAELGAVSEAVAGEMAAGIRRLSACEAALAVSGIAGPGGGTTVKPVGLVCFGWSLGERSWTATRNFSGDREAVRRCSVDFALEQLIDALSA